MIPRLYDSIQENCEHKPVNELNADMSSSKTKGNPYHKIVGGCHNVASGKEGSGEVLDKSEKLSVYYHNLFDFPLTFADLIKWKPSKYLAFKQGGDPVIYQSGYYFLDGRRGLVYKRSLRGRISAKKMEIAHKTSQVLSLMPGIKMVAVTGSLAMGNAGDESDIDLFIITGKSRLWTTRILSYLVLKIFGFGLRMSGGGDQKDKLCLNMWMDEADLAWRKGDRNIYTAHEIAQVLPLVNKDNTYEKFLFKNKWILEFWPNAVKIANCESKISRSRSGKGLLERVSYRIQLNHMKSKITREIVTPTRAIFHPQDWGKVIVERLAS